MPERGSKEIISDIIEAIKRIKKKIKNMEYEEFLKDVRTQDASFTLELDYLPQDSK